MYGKQGFNGGYVRQGREIVIYQPDEVTRLEVRVNEETVWLTQVQMAFLFQTTPQNITIHIRNIYKEGELDTFPTCKEYLQVQSEGTRTVRRIQKVYNLDVIISVGYRVKSIRGTQFRQWANKVLKEYLLQGLAVHTRLQIVENKLEQGLMILKEHGQKIDFFVRTSLPPVEGVFFDGQIFDAYAFASNLIKSARTSLILIDNYIDESVLLMLSKRLDGVTAEIRTGRLTETLKQDLVRHNAQYPPITLIETQNIHDRFLIVDEDVYHIGAFLKDLGKRLFAFSKMLISEGLLPLDCC